jgi:Uri superfamily endonuclease
MDGACAGWVVGTSAGCLHGDGATAPALRTATTKPFPHNRYMIPSSPGTYLLVMRCLRPGRVRVGRTGILRLVPGCYVYVGSAFGPGGLRGRIRHHARRAKRPHWHVDYIRRYTQLESVWYVCGVRCEHQWATELRAMPGAAPEMRGFGSSDCKCPTHLFRFERRPIPEHMPTGAAVWHIRCSPQPALQASL